MFTLLRKMAITPIIAVAALVALSWAGDWPAEEFPGFDDGTRVASVEADWHEMGDRKPIVTWEIGNDVSGTDDPEKPFNRSGTVRKGDLIAVRLDLDNSLLTPASCRLRLDGDVIPGSTKARGAMGVLQCRAEAIW